MASRRQQRKEKQHASLLSEKEVRAPETPEEATPPANHGAEGAATQALEPKPVELAVGQSTEEPHVNYIDSVDIKKGSYLLINQHVAKVVELSTSKTGKHGGCKVAVIALDVFNGRKYQELYCSSRKVEVPEVSKVELQVARISDDLKVCRLVREDGTAYPTPLPLEEDDPVADKIVQLHRAGTPVTAQVLRAMGREKIVFCREKPAARRG